MPGARIVQRRRAPAGAEKAATKAASEGTEDARDQRLG
jgi:hypothetical protein